MRDKSRRGPSTTSVHGAGHRGESAAVTPIYQTSTFSSVDTDAILATQDGRGDPDRFYTRYGNPTQRAAAERVALLEGTEDALVAASGMAGISAVLLTFARTGGRIVATSGLYGATVRHLNFLAERFGVSVDYVPVGDADALERAVMKGPLDLLYLETPTNPLLALVDLEAAARLAREAGAVTAVDSTFATPVNTRPHDLGIDLVVHSATKYLAGHSDILAGAVAGSREHVAEVYATLRMHGGILDPHAAFLLERGLKTLPVRMGQHNANAQSLAEHLEGKEGVARVHYPGLPSHPQHDLAKRQMPGGFGGVLSVDLESGEKAAREFAEGLDLFLNAPSLGGVESLVSIPVHTSHRLPEADLRRLGISGGTVRLACGIEDTADLVADVDAALAKLS